MRLAGRYRRASIALACGLVMLTAAVALGASGSKIVLPVGAKPTVNGLSITIDCEWAETRGYRPVTITVNCTPTAVADRSLLFELAAGSWPGRNFSVTEFELEIPAGSSTVSKVVSLAQLGSMQYLSLDVWEDGVHIDDLSTKNFAIGGGGLGGMGQMEMPSILFVTSKQHDLSRISFLTYGPGQSAVPGQVAFGNATQVATFIERPATGLVENWINYVGLDVIFLSLADVESLAATRPKVWQALAKWTRAGGNLCVYGVGDDWQGLATLDRLTARRVSEKEAAKTYRGWSAPPANLYGLDLQLGNNTVLEDDDATDTTTTVPGAAAPGGMASAPKKGSLFGVTIDLAKPNKRVPPTKMPFVITEVGFGRVVGIASATPFPGDRRQWQWLFNTITPERWRGRVRQGLSFDFDNQGFDNFLIGDVGLPPITMYQVLISLFVVVIGPVNYWLLRRHGRLHLMLFTVPAAALLVTAGLLGYVFIADGLESRLRARSFTFLDQKTHEATSWARLSYYTGLAPSGGLSFPADTAVLPLEKEPRWDNYRGGRTRYVDWTSQQHLKRGWIASRTPTQYETMRAHSTPRELVVTTDEQTGACSVRNLLGVPIKQLVVCDAGGAYFTGSDIAAAARADLKPIETDGKSPKNSGRDFVAELLRHPTRFPGDAAADATSSSRGFFGSSRYRYAWRGNPDDHGTNSSLLEQELGKVGGDVSRQLLKPRSYLAIVERPDDIVTGMDGLIETQSVHVISGTW